ncbi:MAG: helix-turn-helix domain-containing protein, partial [bacterium]|nr:helix-turn-helix domain-containing protein [bacterium]
MEHELSALTGLGFSPTESACYIALIKLGSSSASAVAIETGLQRTAVYPILRGLAERGIVNVYEKQGKKAYQAQRPERVAGYYQRKLKTFEEIIPTIRSLAGKHTCVVGIRFLETKKELKAFYQ